MVRGPEESGVQATLWNGGDRVCGARVSIELQHRGGHSATSGMVVRARVEVAREHVHRVVALLRDQPPDVRLTLGKTAEGPVINLTKDLLWRVRHGE